MIDIRDKRKCCGCQACHEACPAKCIDMVPDTEGFLYPRVRQVDCLDCHLCEQVCPELNRRSPDRSNAPRACYAAISKDQGIRLQSSSGGIFTLLAEAILEKGGVVFGARFDDHFTVYHDCTETPSGLAPLRGSKYVQSDLRGAYTQVRHYLSVKRPVLFSGTPCQIAGLRGFLRGQDEEKLYLVSVVCHGAPSPRVWQEYLDEVTGGVPPDSVNMRNKNNGWSRYKMLIQRGGQDLLNIQATDTSFIRAFLANLTLRPACYACPFRGDHGSDLTLGDYWGVEQVHPEYSDNLGTSLILPYSEKGERILSALDLDLKESHYEDALKGNPSLVTPPSEPPERAMFWRAFHRRGVRVLDSYTTYDMAARIRKYWLKLWR